MGALAAHQLKSQLAAWELMKARRAKFQQEEDDAILARIRDRVTIK